MELLPVTVRFMTTVPTISMDRKIQGRVHVRIYDERGYQENQVILRSDRRTVEGAQADISRWLGGAWSEWHDCSGWGRRAWRGQRFRGLL